jgi:hypothetical protein
MYTAAIYFVPFLVIVHETSKPSRQACGSLPAVETASMKCVAEPKKHEWHILAITC